MLQAANGLDALNVLAAEADVQLVLTDIAMPKMDGLELASHLSGKTKPLFLFMTGYDQYHTEISDPILHKPFTPSMLCAAVEHLLTTGHEH